MKKIQFAALMSILLLTYAKVAAQGYSRKKTDSLLAILPLLQNDTTKVKALYEIAYDYQYINPTAGLKYGKEAVSLATFLQFKKGIATACAMTGLNYAALSDFKNALLYETRAITYYRQTEHKSGEAAMLSNISVIYTEQSNYPKALEYAYASLKIYEALNLKTNQAYLLDNIGTIFFRNNNYNKALSCFEKSEAIYTSEKDRAGLARVKANKGMVFQEMNELDKALQLHSEALQINRETGSRRGEQINLTNIGNVWLAKEDFDKAIQFYELALALSREIKSEGDIATTTGNMGIAYYKVAEKTGKSSPKANMALQKAIRLLEESVRGCEKLLLIQPNIEFLLSLSEAYTLNGNYKEAYNSLKKHIHLHDSINSSSVKEQIASIEMTREMELKNKNLKLKEQELQIRELELTQKRFITGIYISVIFIFLTIIIVLYRRYRKQKSTSKELMRLNEDYLQKINDQLSDLKKHSKVLSEISYMQAHEVRGPLSTLLGMIQLFRKDDLNHPDNIHIMEHLEEITIRMDEAVKEVVRKENELLN